MKSSEDLSIILDAEFHAARQHPEAFRLDAYQRQARRTVDPVQMPSDRLANFALGLAGEAGETAELVKKHLYHGAPLDREQLRKELGDVLWYVATLAHAAGLNLGDVALGNVEKLRKRYPEGFSVAASAARVDVVPQPDPRVPDDDAEGERCPVCHAYPWQRCVDECSSPTRR